MSLKRLFKDKYAGSSPENASVVRSLFDLFSCVQTAPGSKKNNKKKEEKIKIALSYPKIPNRTRVKEFISEKQKITEKK